MGGGCRQRENVLLAGKIGKRNRIRNRGRSKKGQGVRTWAGDRQRREGRRKGRREGGVGIERRMGQGKVSSRGRDMSQREIGSNWGQGQG